MMKLIGFGAELEGSKRNGFNNIARDMEATGFGNPLLYFNTRENYYTHVPYLPEYKSQ